MTDNNDLKDDHKQQADNLHALYEYLHDKFGMVVADRLNPYMLEIARDIFFGERGPHASPPKS